MLSKRKQNELSRQTKLAKSGMRTQMRELLKVYDELNKAWPDNPHRTFASFVSTVLIVTPHTARELIDL